MVLNGKEDNMLIGDPYKFAVLFDRVKKWNPSLTDNNGFFALCIDGKLFPDEIENAVIPVGVYLEFQLMKKYLTWIQKMQF